MNLAVGNWGWGSFLGGLWLACLLSYRWARHQEDKINEITAYIDWLEWKGSET